MTEDNKRALLREYNRLPHSGNGALVRCGMERALRELGFRFAYEDAKSLNGTATDVVEVSRG